MWFKLLGVPTDILLWYTLKSKQSQVASKNPIKLILLSLFQDKETKAQEFNLLMVYFINQN